MDIKKYIESGILELYVAGVLSEKENQEVYQLGQQHEEIQQEIESIEKALKILSKELLPEEMESSSFEPIKNKIHQNDEKVIPISRSDKPTKWVTYIGWAASAILAGGLFWMFNQNNNLKSEIQTVEIKNAVLEGKVDKTTLSFIKATELLSILRDKNRTEVPLAGQAVAPTAFANVYVKEGDDKVYIDALGLPEPPKGKVYQVWSLKLDPLTPTSIGLLSDFASDENKIFELNNGNESEAFGITLEPEGGSESPNLEQLYTLGVVAATP